MNKEKEGWSWLFNSRVEHYFVEGKSLCGKWGILGYGDCAEHTNNPCDACMKKLEKRKQKGHKNEYEMERYFLD
jgi:hypothetical protein